MRLFGPLLVLALCGCTPTNTSSYEQCELDFELEPARAAVGESVEALGSPQSAILDTNVRVNGVDAEVTTLDFPEACATCDACRTNAECLSCETCDVCAAECAECVPTLTFVVPEVEPGPAGVLITNLFGTSPPLDLEVTAAAEGQ